MFDKLDDILIHYEELMRMLGGSDVTQTPSGLPS